ncbi:MAG: PDZ domain-containing protein [Phycisphaerales bacterium]
MTTIRSSLFLLITTLLLPACAAQPGVDYTVRLDRARNQIVRIEATIDQPGEQAEFVLPTWRPGRYGILDFAATVRTFDAVDQSGQPLPVEKIRKNAWVVDSVGAESVTFGYDIFANELGLRTRHADDSHVFLNGSSIFVMNPPRRLEEHIVRFDGLGDWRLASGLEKADTENALVAASFDVLVDSPIEIGEHRLIEFELRGVDFEIVIWGECAKSDEELSEDFGKIAEACMDIFKSNHFDRYVFLIHSADGIGGGTEHLNSTIMQTRPSSFTSESGYRGFLGLVTHEFFHTWNVKHFRPAGITPYDYDKENYTTQLWVAEGSTSYYDDLLLARTGQRSIENYLDALAGAIGSVRGNPGRAMTTVEQASYDAWLKFWGPSSPDHRNTNVSIYTQGHVISLALDMLIRNETESASSFDDVMQLMNDRYPHYDGGYTPTQFKETVAEVAWVEVDEFFDRHISGVEQLPLEELLSTVGLELTLRDPDPAPFAGFSLRDSDGKSVVSRVYDNGPAFEAGLILDDEIVSANGVRIDSDKWSDILDETEIGDSVTLGMFRRGNYREVELTITGKVSQRYDLDLVEEPTDSQRFQFEDWIGQPWPEDD